MSYNIKLKERIDDYHFAVQEHPVKTACHDIVIPGTRAIVRSDTEEVLGLVKSTYKVLTHEEALDPILEILDKSGHELHKNISLTHSGARMYADISFKDLEREAASDDRFWPGITIVNSLDGTRKYHAELCLLRLVCTNGMRLPEVVSSFSTHHSKNAEFESAIDKVTHILDDPETFDFISRWNQIPGPDKRDTEKILKVVEDITDRNDSMFPKRYAPNVAEYYQNAENGFTVWNLYNAFNSVLEHDLKRGKGKIERARDLDANLFKTFSKIYA